VSACPNYGDQNHAESASNHEIQPIPCSTGCALRIDFGMVGPMRSARLGSLLSFVLLGCGGAVEDPLVFATGGHTATPGTGGSSSVVPQNSGGTSTGGQVYSTYSPQGCPDASAAPIVTQLCDPFSEYSGCSDGSGCFPAVRSSEDPCQPAQYSFICVRAGTGRQADKCDQAERCAPGYVCVVTNTGTRCQRVCNTTDESSCPPGLFCDPIDVPGVGTCS
jgi:hypothetical protein